MTDKLDIGYMLAVWFRQEIIAVRYRKHNCLSLKEVSVKKKVNLSLIPTLGFPTRCEWDWHDVGQEWLK